MFVVPPEKRARAVTGLNVIVNGAAVLFQEYRDLAMFVNSLLGVVRESRKIMHWIYVSLGWGIDPDGRVQVLVFACEPALRWLAVLARARGCTARRRARSVGATRRRRPTWSRM